MKVGKVYCCDTFAGSLLSDEAKERYLSLFRDRLRAIAQ